MCNDFKLTGVIMTMKEITIDERKTLAKQYDLHVCRIKGSEVLQLRQNPSDKYEDISWEEFEAALQEKDLAVYKAEKK